MDAASHDELDEPSAIPIPPRRRMHRTQQGSSQRRQSLPARSLAASEPSSTDHVHIQPASPEVISSLISSLSTISSPARNHFDSLPKIGSHTAPSSPNCLQSEFPQDDLAPPPSPGFGMDYGAYRTPLDDSISDFLHPDDAAISPIVRMSKPPARSRSRRSSRSTKRESSLIRSGSRASYASSQNGKDEFSSFGIVSLEPGPRLSMTSIASSSSGGRKSLKTPLSILKRSSREFFKDKDADRLSVADGNRLSSSRSRLSLRSTPSMADLAEEGSGDAEHLQPPEDSTPRRDSAPSLNSSHTATDFVTLSPGGIGSGRFIPARESSLRYKNGGASKKRRSTRHSIYSSRDFTIDRDIAEVNGENDRTPKGFTETNNQQQNHKDSSHANDKPAGQYPSTPKISPQSSVKHVTPSGTFKRRDSTSLEQTRFTRLELSFDLEESAPSPTVQTRRTTSVKKRNSGPLASKTTNIQPMMGKQERHEPLHKAGKRRSNGANSDTRSHRRVSSGVPSPVPQTPTGADERPSSADSVDDAVRAYMMAARLTQKVRHPQTGRTIAFSEVGDPGGHVVFCCVGMGLTRYLTAFYDELARTLKLRLITPDRPGVGESEPCADGSGPLSWPDDLATICNHLKITKFSILAHSAGAIYALATALRMPQHIRGRLHLLAPWIPPSQMSGMGSHKDPLPANALPYSQRILRALPTPILKVANSRFMTTTSASVTSSLPKTSRKNKRLNALAKDKELPAPVQAATTAGTDAGNGLTTVPRTSVHRQSQDIVSRATSDPSGPNAESAILAAAAAREDRERQSDYDNRLTHAIWELATTNANPAVDLLICLERRQTIGFRYNDITRSVVIHHGSKDTRVPVDNVRWLGKTMRRCEVRVLEGEGHGLMASATVMGNVLMEMAKEWEDWTTVVQGRRDRRATVTAR
ncbi:hypothetical protein D8B26_006831 [Coccidioides posadasii str. Silveira]|uniref:Hydrolase n=1 Tax=Coccidioides posadasii (strain RMSCC 757 / Silveira) TaxID=443226 RepID=E9CRW3_COCPS|nr:hydrolase [Coccidioides posadasii str. Silveira]QVM12196.1 hypothetical protein D8B26_006831 [Coccidioides posadasii str. Silveira]